MDRGDQRHVGVSESAIAGWATSQSWAWMTSGCQSRSRVSAARRRAWPIASVHATMSRSNSRSPDPRPRRSRAHRRRSRPGSGGCGRRCPPGRRDSTTNLVPRSHEFRGDGVHVPAQAADDDRGVLPRDHQHPHRVILANSPDRVTDGRELLRELRHAVASCEDRPPSGGRSGVSLIMDRASVPDAQDGGWRCAGRIGVAAVVAAVGILVAIALVRTTSTVDVQETSASRSPAARCSGGRGCSGRPRRRSACRSGAAPGRPALASIPGRLRPMGSGRRAVRRHPGRARRPLLQRFRHRQLPWRHLITAAHCVTDAMVAARTGMLFVPGTATVSRRSGRGPSRLLRRPALRGQRRHRGRRGVPDRHPCRFTTRSRPSPAHSGWVSTPDRRTGWRHTECAGDGLDRW